MENPMIEQFMIEVFEKAKKDSGITARDPISKHIESRIGEIFHPTKDGLISAKTIERLHRRYIEKHENVDGAEVPNERFKNQLAKYLGYHNYHEYTAHIHREESNSSNEFYIGSNRVTKIQTMHGDININKKTDE